MSLPLDCLTRDASGAPVLIYDNLKRDREGRRLPVSEHTAAVITAQQERVTGRYPATPRSRLALLPTPKLNPGGSKNITVDRLEEQDREWVTSLGPLRTSGGAVFDSAKIVLYAYRHTFAQRHANAGVSIDVLAELLDHKDLSVTRRVLPRRRRPPPRRHRQGHHNGCNRHGNRTWREARALLDTEHARYVIGQVAVPYGTCTSRPTSPRAAAPARSGSAAPAATTSAPTSPTCPT